jgi:diguanylate cyclase (GGDEF)-like protein
MRIFHAGAIVILDAEKKPAGIITESDILRAVHESNGNITGKNAGSVMASPIISLSPDENVENAALLMSTNRIRRVPVVDNGKLAGLLSYRDLTEDMRKTYYMLDEMIENRANKDALTGLFNRGYGMEQLKYHFELSKRIKMLLAVYLFDLDHFKEINDTYGHLCGDRVLKTAAHIIRDCARSVDIVSRYGGEEFMITGFTAGPDAACILPERIRKNLAKTEFYFEGKKMATTISAGVALWSEKYRSAEELLQKADTALYEAKKAGRNRVAQYKN